MKLEKVVRKTDPPCDKCPYTLGLVHTLTNPCVYCKQNGYQMYKYFTKQIPEQELRRRE